MGKCKRFYTSKLKTLDHFLFAPQSGVDFSEFIDTLTIVSTEHKIYVGMITIMKLQLF